MEKVLRSGRAEELLSAADLFVLAFALEGTQRVLPVNRAVEVLCENGLSSPDPSLAERFREAASADHRFIQFSKDSFCLDLRVDQVTRMRDALERAFAPSAREARLRAEARAAPDVARPRAPNRPPPEPPKRAAPGPKAAPAPEPPALPPAPPLTRAPETFAIFTEAQIDEHLRAAPPPAEGLARVRHVLAAHRLASAEQFEELLSFASLTDVEPHRYQIETVRRVLRSFRGRALLADEVGLGKTIEALIILREYQLRGMVRRALVLVPPALVRQWSGEIAAKIGIEARCRRRSCR